MTMAIFREVVTLAFFAITLWAFGIHWQAFATGAALVAVDAYMAHRRGQRAREHGGVLFSDQF
jgi:hypothetical protein